MNNFESRQVGNRVPGNFKRAAPTLSISELSDTPRRTPKKPLMTAEVNKLKYRLLLLSVNKILVCVCLALGAEGMEGVIALVAQ